MILPIGLALCVFSWGLQYKLSLYNPPNASFHRVPKATLLSKNEQSTIYEESASSKTKLLVKILRGETYRGLLILIAAFVLGLPIVIQNQRWANASWRIRRVTLDAFFVRPPPFLA